MANYDFKQLEGKVSAAKDWLAKEYRGLRTGRAAPAILDGVAVPAYGSMVPLKQVANVGVEDARTLRVQPFDAALLKDIERAISAASLGVGTSSDGATVRVSFPELSGERREQLIKLAKGKLEEARTTVRLARDETKKDIETKERNGELTKDDKFRLGEELQKRVDKANEELQKAFESKEKEMSS
ncbi:ribosome recycling factor [Candidatus Kaiserbacteria bacterium RIFCSPHIGHO2_01_FULL_55_17]|uniref:Ribosome recycling factor n=1 Tax=Candidatus Kaiserbacteria bacterium RIFCSPHIGHO2_01_FULL_55_17 TaxID=1798484 RepID=A0A1F6D8H0_9BACT|nr:MAG: ribosome recycling factor [Candidatus Kaiserbacteria bacterium RIFCSPHIGHO2_01_FULL_55_17]